MPLSLYICDSLVYLRLHRVWLGKFESFSLPRLKTMRLEENVYASGSDAGLESFISSCPVLQDLSMFLFYYMDVDRLPQFCNLSRLKAKIPVSCLEILPTLLESVPNLKSLVLVMGSYPAWEDVELSLSSVPRCLLSSLEFVEINYFNGLSRRMELARYLIENSGVLQKLVLHLRCSMLEEGYKLLRDLLALPRGSTACRIIIC